MKINPNLSPFPLFQPHSLHFGAIFSAKFLTDVLLKIVYLCKAANTCFSPSVTWGWERIFKVARPCVLTIFLKVFKKPLQMSSFYSKFSQGAEM